MSEPRLGPLEARVLDALWARRCPCSVRELQPVFPAVAYTTLMTTLDRLHRKGILRREKQGRAFVYQPHATRETFHATQATGAINRLLADPSAQGPLLSFLVDTVGNHDESLLDELERLIREKRAQETS